MPPIISSSSSSSTVQSDSSSNGKNTNSWVPFIVPKQVLKNSPSCFFSLNLPHPKTKESCVFVLHSSLDHSHFHSIFALEHISLSTSCFFQDLVISDGTTLVAIPIDPLFLLLPMIESQASRHYTSLDTILHSSANSNWTSLTLLPQIESKLKTICEFQSLNDTTVFRFSKEKTTDWLSKKLLKLATYLYQKENPQMNSASTSNMDFPKEIYIKAIDYLNEWVSTSWIDSIKQHLSLDLTVPSVDALSLILQQNIRSQTKASSRSTNSEPELKKPKKSAPSKPASISKNQSTLSSFFKKP